MTTTATLLPPTRKPPLTFGRLLIFYVIVASIPFIYSLAQGLEGIETYETGATFTYETLVTYLNITVFAALLAQYPLAGRINAVTQVTGLDNGMQLHRKAGQYIALYFFLHPFLIVAPRFFASPQRANGDLWDSIIAGESSTGVYAWVIMGIWVLLSIYRKKLKIGYDAWRISHGLGLVAVAVLGTHHAISVGRHGRYDIWFDVMWVVLCAIAVGIVSFIYFVRPLMQKKQPFKLVSATKISESDWELTIEKDGDFDFNYDAGQFLWINTTGNPYNRTEHPFSMASSPTSLPKIQFIIRELGDFTNNLGKLKPGQRVYVDGPHGVFTLNGRQATGVALLAGGAGIGPNMGILRQLRDLGDSRPVRLVYGNRRMSQMCCQDEIAQIAADMDDFKQELSLETPEAGVDAHIGYLDKDYLASLFDEDKLQNWIFYVCGPPVMVDAVVDHLRALDVPEKQIQFEQLSFD